MDEEVKTTAEGVTKEADDSTVEIANQGDKNKDPYGSGRYGDYSNANTKTYGMEIMQQYKDSVNEYNSLADNAVQQGVQQLQAMEAAANNAYSKTEQNALRDYREMLDTRSGIEQANGNRQQIGESQYGTPENAYGNALDAIRASQAQMTRDVARQVADLRDQGDYQKANALLQAAQASLTQQYADAIRRDNNLRSNYEYLTANDREDAAIAREQSATDKAWLREIGMTLLQRGVMPDSATLEAMGISSTTARSIITRVQTIGSGGGGGGGSGRSSGSGSGSGSGYGSGYGDYGVGSDWNSQSADDIRAMAARGETTAAYAATQQSGMSQATQNALNQYSGLWSQVYANPTSQASRTITTATYGQPITTTDWYSKYY